jgi:hypothetical protein
MAIMLCKAIPEWNKRCRENALTIFKKEGGSKEGKNDRDLI